MNEKRIISVKDFYLLLNLDHNFDDNDSTFDSKLLLEKIAEKLGGKLSYETCITKNTEHRKIVIEYGHQRKSKDLS